MRSALLLALVLVAPVRAQVAFSLGSTGFDAVRAVAQSPDGDFFVGGDFEETVDLDPGSGAAMVTSAGFDDAFLAHYAADGSFTWGFALGGGSSDRIAGVAVDPLGRVYVTGHYSETVDFDPGPGTFEFTSGGSQSAFVAAYGADGAFRWALSLGGDDLSLGRGIAVDGDAVFVTGGFEGTSDFDPGPAAFPLAPNRGADAFVASYTTDGAFRWAFPIGTTASTGASFDEGTAIAARDGHVWVAGMASGLADFQGGPDLLLLDAGPGFQDLYLARYAADGPATGPMFEWGFLVGDVGFDAVLGLAVGDALDCYVTGIFEGTADFDPGASETLLTSDGGSTDAFVAAFGELGGFHWAFRLGETGYDAGNAIAVTDGAIYVGGSFASTVDFAPGGGTPVQADGLDDAFVARYDAGPSSASLVWVNHLGAPGASDATLALVQAPGGPLATGVFQESADVDPGTGTTTLQSAGIDDGFVLQYALDGAFPTASDPDLPEAPVALAVAPNPAASRAAVTLTLDAAQIVAVAVFDALGRRVATLHDGPLAAGAHPFSLDASELPAGLYVIRATGARGARATRRLIVAR